MAVAFLAGERRPAAIGMAKANPALAEGKKATIINAFSSLRHGPRKRAVFAT